jgi:hypothetical protein
VRDCSTRTEEEDGGRGEGGGELVIGEQVVHFPECARFRNVDSTLRKIYVFSYNVYVHSPKYSVCRHVRPRAAILGSFTARRTSPHSSRTSRGEWSPFYLVYYSSKLIPTFSVLSARNSSIYSISTDTCNCARTENVRERSGDFVGSVCLLLSRLWRSPPRPRSCSWARRSRLTFFLARTRPRRTSSRSPRLV